MLRAVNEWVRKRAAVSEHGMASVSGYTWLRSIWFWPSQRPLHQRHKQLNDKRQCMVLLSELLAHSMVLRRREANRHGMRFRRPPWSAWHRQRRRDHASPSGLGKLGVWSGSFAVDDADRKPSRANQRRHKKRTGSASFGGLSDPMFGGKHFDTVKAS